MPPRAFKTPKTPSPIPQQPLELTKSNIVLVTRLLEMQAHHRPCVRSSEEYIVGGVQILMEAVRASKKMAFYSALNASQCGVPVLTATVVPSWRGRVARSGARWYAS